MALVAPPIPASWDPTGGIRFLNYYWAAIFVLLLVHRIVGVIRRARGAIIHSGYIGDSVFSLIFRRWRMTACRGLELIVGFGTGAFLLGVCQILGACVMLSALADSLFVALLDEKHRRTAQNAIDSQIEAATFSDRIRRMTGN